MKNITANALVSRLFALFAAVLTLYMCASPAMAAETFEDTDSFYDPYQEQAQEDDLSYLNFLRESGILSGSDAEMLRFAAERQRIEPNDRSDSMYFDTWSVIMRVRRNRSIEITEDFDVYFNTAMHGMTRTLPSYSSAESFEIRDMRIVGSPYHFDGDTIYLGSAAETVRGLQHYTIQYTIANFEDSYSGYDRLYRDIVGSEVEYPIYNILGGVILDDGMTFDDITIYTGRYGETGSQYVKSLVSDNKLLIYNTREFARYNAVTLDAKLPDGAFSEPALLQPDYIVDDLVINSSIDKYGMMHVEENYDITVLSDGVCTFSRILPQEYDPPVEREIENITLTKNGGEPRKGKLEHQLGIECPLEPADGNTVRITVSYDVRYLIRSGEGDADLRLPLITYNDDSICKYKNVEFDLETPFELSSQLGHFGIYTGNYNSLSGYENDVHNANYYFTNDIGENSVTSRLTGEEMPIGETVTLEMSYVKGALERKAIATDYILSILGIAGIGGLLTGLFKKKSSEKQLTPSVQFYPPAGLNPAEIGYIIDNECENRDITSLIYYWASKGALNIEIPNKRGGFILHRLGALSPEHRDYEKELFNRMFAYGTGTSVKDSQLSTKLYTHVNTAAAKVKHVFTGSQRFFTQPSSTISGLLPFAVPVLVWLGAVIASVCWGRMDGTATPIAISGILSLFAARFIKNSIIKKHKNSPAKNIFRTILTVVLILLSFFIIFFCGGGSIGIITAIILSALVIANALIAPRLLRRTDFYTDLLGLVVGFKEFLQTAEKERLKLLLEENPTYYYDILPYAQVLGVSKQWLSRFDGLTMQAPGWFYGPAITPYTFNSMLNSNMTRMNNSMTSVPAPSSSGGGFSGGSFGGGFSGGGGGFSGGGGGGGAGGW